jgi:hypothetical protein
VLLSGAAPQSIYILFAPKSPAPAETERFGSVWKADKTNPPPVIPFRPIPLEFPTPPAPGHISPPSAAEPPSPVIEILVLKVPVIDEILLTVRLAGTEPPPPGGWPFMEDTKRACVEMGTRNSTLLFPLIRQFPKLSASSPRPIVELAGEYIVKALY